MNTSLVNFRELLKRPVCLLGLGLGSGLAPKAPGTCGTLVAIPVYLLLQPQSITIYLAVVITAFIVGIRICQQSANWLGQTDPSAVVWDEMVGFLITMTAAPTGWQWIVLGFLLFRFFDILKPWPINLADKLFHGGFGIMFDDVLAGLFALICVQWLAHLGTAITVNS